jgi:uncharacterized repeat protein (TIGR01451 family)
MYYQDEEIAIYVAGEADGVFDADDYVLFYGEQWLDQYTDENIYWLTVEAGVRKRMTAADAAPAGAPTPDHFPVSIHIEEDVGIGGYNPEVAEGEDFWYWGNPIVVSATPGSVTSREFPGASAPSISLANLSTTATTATVRAELRGDSSFQAVNPDHQSEIYLNGVKLDSRQWDGFVTFQHEVTTAHSTLISGTNVFSVAAVAIGGQSHQFFVNWFEIDYWDTYVAENDSLFFGAPFTGTFEFDVTGFTTSTIQVFNVTSPTNVSVMTNTAVVSSYAVQFERSAGPGDRYLALTPGNYQSPSWIVKDTPSAWKSPANGADYVIITYDDFYTSTLPLANHRVITSGLQVATAKISDVYDEFSGGRFSPEAIRTFLTYAYQNWSAAPSYVLLVGDAWFDYRNILGLGAPYINYVPHKFVGTADFGLAPSDNWFVLVSGDDPLPDMFVGRLSAQDETDVGVSVGKILGYEQNPPPASWNQHMVLVADDGDNATERYQFEQTTAALAELVPYDYTTTQLYVATLGDSTTQTQIKNNLNPLQGTILLNYIGHGNASAWGDGIFGRTAITELSNGDRLPLVTIANCQNGLFTNPTNSMAEDFIQEANKGAVGVFAPSSQGYPSSQRQLLIDLYETIFQDDVTEMGVATTLAKIELYSTNPALAELVNTFIYFGDPALAVGIPANPPYVESVTPAPDTSDAPVVSLVTVDFSKPMSTATVNLSSLQYSGPLTPTWSSNDTVVSYQHSNFDLESVYTFTISGQDKLGQSITAGPLITDTWSFTTGTGGALTVGAAGGTLIYVNPQGYTTTVQVPPGALYDTIRLLLIPEPGELDNAPDGKTYIPPYSFQLDAYQGDTLLTVWPFQKPLTITIDYSETLTNEQTFEFWQVELLGIPDSNWRDAALSCSPTSAYQIDSAANRISLPICSWGDDAVRRLFLNRSADKSDFGDAPDSYSTLLSSDGPRHVLSPSLYLGSIIDGESDGQPTGAANGDDTDFNGDDEDGVAFGIPLRPGMTGTLTVTASAAGKLDGWLDFNADGDWADANEQIFIAEPLIAGANPLTITAPATSTLTLTTFARFRLSTAGNLPYTGTAAAGEVEDYQVGIVYPELQLAKSASREGAEVGQVITYSYTITNSGLAALTGVTLFDDQLGTITPGATALTAGYVTTATVTYTVQAGDLPGPLTNTATVSGSMVGGTVVTTTATATVTLFNSPGLTVTKRASTTSAELGEVITYSYRVTNTGDVSLINVVAEDDRLGTVGISGTLLPGAWSAVVLTDTVVEAYLPGPLTNTVVVTGTPPVGNDLVVEAVVGVALTSNPGLTVTKRASTTSAEVGEVITYSYRMTNTGDVSLINVVAEDDRLGTVGISGTLLPGEWSAVVLTDTVVEAYLPGPLTNTVVVTGTPPVGNDLVVEAVVGVALTSSPGLTVTKRASATSAEVGEVITYSYRVTNSGNVSLVNVVAEDDQLGTVGISGTLLPGEWSAVVLTDTVVEGYLPGPLTNTVVVTGTPPLGNDLVVEAVVGVALTSSPGLTVTKQASATSAEVGEVITYSYRVTNSGNVSLVNVVAEDDQLGTVGISGTLLPGEWSVVVLTDTVVEGYLPGPLTNTVVVTGTPPLGNDLVVEAVVGVALTSSPGLTVTKRASATSAEVGEVITYSYRVTNTGNVNVSGLQALDDKLGPILLLPGSLNPGQVATGQATQTIIEALLPGPLENSVSITATPSAGQPFTVAATERVYLTSSPAILVSKSASLTEALVGQTITYTFRITNSGNVTLDPVTALDDKLGPVPLQQTRLQPLQATTAVLTYIVAQSDLSTIAVTNTVRVTGTSVGNADVTTQTVAVVSMIPSPAITISKTASLSVAEVGQTITYTYQITNSGLIALGGISAVDSELGSVPLPVTILSVGQFSTGILTYTVQEADLFRGRITNSVTVTGTAQFGAPTVAQAQASEAVTPVDTDGVDSETEDNAPNGGDGNGDVISDSLQSNVVSLPNAADSAYLTIEAPSGIRLRNVGVLTPTAVVTLPDGIIFPEGIINFEMEPVSGPTVVTMTLHSGLTPESYWKYGPETEGAADRWYEFTFDATTGATINGNQIRLVYVDDARGDNLPDKPNWIGDPGGPGILAQTKTFLPIILKKD